MESGKFKFIILSLFIVFAGFTSCTKEKLYVVPNNDSPTDNVVEPLIIENYINKAYIALLGRKPSESEYSIAYKTLILKNYKESERQNFIKSITAKSEFYEILYRISRDEYLNGLDTNEIPQYIFIFQSERDKPQNAKAVDQYNYEIDRLWQLRRIPQQFANRTLIIDDMYKRIVNNSFYDDLNMGAANFVISLFQNFLFRYPTKEEETAGVDMVNHKASVIFYKNGVSKDDLISIFFSTRDYREGQVRTIYKRYLFREPTTVEFDTWTTLLQKDPMIENLLIKILASDDYAGIKK